MASANLKAMADATLLQDPLRFERRVPPCTIVIFGANGDLTKRKLIPALYRLAYERRLSPSFAVIGTCVAFWVAVCEVSETLTPLQRTSSRNGKPETERLAQS